MPPNTPAQASTNVAPPVFALPFGEIRSDGQVYPTIPFLEFLQTLWTSIAGSGGIIDNSYLLVNAPPLYPPLTAAQAQPWIPTIAGTTVAGAQTYATQWGSSISLGPLTIASFNVAMVALDGATAGDVQIRGLPVSASPSAPGPQGGLVATYADVVQITGITQIGVAVAPGAAVMAVRQSAPAWPGQPLPAAGLTATSAFVGAAIYFH